MTETSNQATPKRVATGPQRAIPVLLYHSVPQESDSHDPLSVPYEQFAAHLDAIVASGRTPTTLGELAAGLRDECRLPDHAVAITFDDAYEDTLDAIELLRARGLRASVYVTTGKIDTESMLRRDQLEQLAVRPGEVELGAHSVTHPHLDELSLAEIEREVSDSKLRLEQLTGHTITTFAYPYGSYDPRVRTAVIAAGYRSAAAVKNALSHPHDDPWAIARWTVDATTSAQRIAEVLDAHDVPYAWGHERLRTRGYRLARRLRRRITRGRERH